MSSLSLYLAHSHKRAKLRTDINGLNRTVASCRIHFGSVCTTVQPSVYHTLALVQLRLAGTQNPERTGFSIDTRLRSPQWHEFVGSWRRAGPAKHHSGTAERAQASRVAGETEECWQSGLQLLLLRVVCVSSCHCGWRHPWVT